MEIITKYSSPHFRKTRRAEVDTLVMHYISAVNIDKEDPFNEEKIIDLLTKPIPIGNGKSVKVSAHYLIGRDGKIFRLVDEEHVAWHAGKSKLPDGKNIKGSCNDFSIGIEIMGGKWIGYEDAQYEAIIELIKDIKTRHEIEYLLGHEDIAPGRKTDPGEHFDWERVRAGLENKKIVTKQEKEIKIESKMENNITDGVSEEETEETEDKQGEKIESPKSNIVQTIIEFILRLLRIKK